MTIVLSTVELDGMNSYELNIVECFYGYSYLIYPSSLNYNKDLAVGNSN